MAREVKEQHGLWVFKILFIVGWCSAAAGAGMIHPGLGLIAAGWSLMFFMYAILTYEDR